MPSENLAWKRKASLTRRRYSQALWKHRDALGVSATHLDWTMIPYVRKSFSKHFRDGLKYCCNRPQDYIDTVPRDLSFDDNEANDAHNKKAYDYAMDMTTKEVYQAVEGMYHNLKIWAQ